jgi:flagellar hook-length control protein FliK
MASATRFVGTPADAPHDLPPQAGDAAAAIGDARASPASGFTALPNERLGPRPSPLATVSTVTTADSAEPPVAPLLRRAVAAASATDGEARPDSAAVPTVPDARAGLAAAAGATTSTTNAVTTPSPLPVAVGAPEWDRHLSERVAVLVDQGLTNAQLKLSPAHLGPLEIRISVQSDQANVWFGTHSHATREALEAAAPRLREMLGAQGFANVGVSVDLQQQAGRGPAGGGTPTRHEPEFSFAAGADVTAPSAGPSAAAPRVERSRLDAFA